MLRAVGADRVPRGALRAPPAGWGETGAGAAIPAPWPTGSPPLTWHDAAHGRRHWARRLGGDDAGLAGGHVGRWTAEEQRS